MTALRLAVLCPRCFIFGDEADYGEANRATNPWAISHSFWADGGYAGAKLAGWMAERFGARPLRREIVRRSDDVKGFAVLPRRWVVERTFAWLHRFRRLSKDFEFRTHSSEAFILIAAARLLISRLAA